MAFYTIPQKPLNKVVLKEPHPNELDSYLKDNRSKVLSKVSGILNKDISIHSLHGIVGGKNEVYGKSIRTRFVDFNDFLYSWLTGLKKKYDRQTNYYNNGDDINSFSAIKITEMLNDEDVFNYVRIFLEKNFYKYFKARTRFKPDEDLWKIWFGNNNIYYGLLISPVYHQSKCKWVNDWSEINHARYNYWTVEHVLSEGLIDPNLDHPIRFDDEIKFFDFYLSVIMRLSNSFYERRIMELYVEYLKESDNINRELFLIPEFRYLGLEQKHLYRLDFTILNSSVEHYVGFEISPASSHMSIQKTNTKTQKEINLEIKKKWEKEIAKRNDYFNTFEINTLILHVNRLCELCAAFYFYITIIFTSLD